MLFFFRECNLNVFKQDIHFILRTKIKHTKIEILIVFIMIFIIALTEKIEIGI